MDTPTTDKHLIVSCPAEAIRISDRDRANPL
jgi:hypothetical protein